MKLTTAGWVLVGEAKRVLASADRAVRLARGTQAGEFGDVRIAYSPFIDLRAVNYLKTALMTLRPSLHITLEGISTAEQTARLSDGTYQAALVLLPYQDADIAAEPLFEEPLNVAMVAGHRLARRRQVNLEELVHEPLIWMTRRSNPHFHDHFLAWCRAAGYEPVVAQEVTGLLECLQFVSDGVGISFVSASARRSHFEGIAIRPLVGPPFPVRTGVAYRRDNSSAVLHSILTVARQQFRNGVGWEMPVAK